jgi:hypothetical protein
MTKQDALDLLTIASFLHRRMDNAVRTPIAKLGRYVWRLSQGTTVSVRVLGRKPDDIFPLRFSVDPTLANEDTIGQVTGSYRFAIGDRVHKSNFEVAEHK